VGRYRINKKLGLESELSVRVLTKEDIIAIIRYLIELVNSKADVDDIDHLSNRRVRTVGEQLFSPVRCRLWPVWPAPSASA
jgi:DNA-directed RNA polymerase subunit beta